MGRLIDIDKAREEYRNLMDLTMSDTTLLHTLYGVLDNAPTVEAIPKDQYEARLRADMVAILDKIRAQIKSNLRGVEIALEVLVENHPLRPKMEGAKDTLEECLNLIDKAEVEPQESEG